MTPWINTERACFDLVRHLFSPKRKLPAIVVSQRMDKTGPVLSGPKLQEQVGPLARVFTLSGSMLKTFNELLNNVYGIEPAGVRFYYPNMQDHDAVGRHPVWNQRKIDEAPEEVFEAIERTCRKRAKLVQERAKHASYSKSKFLSKKDADALFRGLAPEFKTKTDVVPTKHRRLGRKVLTVKTPQPPAPAPEAIEALLHKFA